MRTASDRPMSVMWKFLPIAVLVALLAVLVAPAASAQTAEDVARRDQLIANQENLLNTYRCLFGVDTNVVPGGCPNPDTVSPGIAPNSPTQNDLDVRDGLIQSQEALLNVYRCRFNVDTQIVPGGCKDGQPAPTPTPTPQPAGEALTPAEIFARVSPSIPIVRSCYGQGSGILIEGGYVVTNDHVVWLCGEATVLFPDGTEYTEVPVVAANPWSDLAVLGPIATDKATLALTDGEGLPSGSDLYLIGYPAEFEETPQPTITRGILSRLRQWDSYNLTLLQTDTAIAGGQSGGALVNDRGQVVGISTWSWAAANFGISTSAADQARIIDLMLDEEEGHRYSFDWLSGLGDVGDAQQSFTLPPGRSTQTFFVLPHSEGDVELSLQGCADPLLWVADAFGTYTQPDENGIWPNRVRLGNAAYAFADVGHASADSVSCTLQSTNADLVEYIDESGVVLVFDRDGKAGNAGVFNYFQDSDEHQIALNRGDTVRMWADSTNADLYLTLYDDDGNIVAEDDDSGPLDFLGGSLNPEINYQVTRSGTYYIEVSYLWETSASTTGSYLLFVERAS